MRKVLALGKGRGLGPTVSGNTGVLIDMFGLDPDALATLRG